MDGGRRAGVGQAITQVRKLDSRLCQPFSESFIGVVPALCLGAKASKGLRGMNLDCHTECFWPELIFHASELSDDQSRTSFEERSSTPGASDPDPPWADPAAGVAVAGHPPAEPRPAQATHLPAVSEMNWEWFQSAEYLHLPAPPVAQSIVPASKPPLSGSREKTLLD